MRVTVESLRHYLDVFLWENPEWADCDVVMEDTQGGRVFARKPTRGKSLNIEWEERIIYEPTYRAP